MKVNCNTAEVLAALRANREKHIKIVKEANEGYLKKAEVELSNKIEKIKAGKVVSLQFSLKMPEDHTEEYDTAIKMLEMHTGAEIELSSNEVRKLIEDKWDWKGSFLSNNAIYSATAAIGSEK